MPELVMPRLSDSMEEGTIIKWLKGVGDEIAIGDEIVEIETDKANMAYEADVAGVLTEILAEEGDTLPVRAPIARVGRLGEGPGAVSSAPVATGNLPSHATPPAVEARRGHVAEVGALVEGGEASRVKASPVAKRLAREAGVDLASIQGTGPGGRIVKKDVKKAAAAEADSPAPGPAAQARPAAPSSQQTAKGEVTVEEPSRLQQVVARRMSESKATAPHFYLETTIDMGRAVEARARIKAVAAEGQVIPSFNDMIVKACALALRDFPRANGSYRDGRFELYSRINVGVAVAAREALVVPTVFDADKKGLRQIAIESRALAERVREGQITPPELSGGTFTVSNLGMFGVTNLSAVINAPQAAILAVGAIEERAAIRDHEVVPAQLMEVTLACDHRILYGADGARFLARVRMLLEEPLALGL